MAELTELRLGKRRHDTYPHVPSRNYTLCIICQERIPDSLQSLTIAGYDAFLYAVNNRGDDTAKRLLDDVKCKDNFLSKHPKYHIKCRSRYTNKKTVEQRKRARLNINDVDDVAKSEISIGTRSGISKVDFKKVCFVCEKTRNKRDERTLILITTKERQEQVFRKAKFLDDKKMLHKIQGFGDTCMDLIANGFRYHRKCLSPYLLLTPVKDDSSASSLDKYKCSFDALVSEIEEKILHENTVYFISQLRDKVRKNLVASNVEDAHLYSSKHLVRQLESHFGEKIVVVPQVGTSRLVCSSTLSLSTLLTEVRQLKSRLEEWEYLEYEGDRNDSERCEQGNHVHFQRESFYAAKSIRKEVKSLEMKTRQKLAGREPGKSDLDISYEEASELIPIELYNHISWMIFDVPFDIGIDGRVALTQKQHEQVLNLCQDIIASMSSVPTPKQLGIALHVIKQTRSKETVTLLNRLGNSISYYDAQRYITSMAINADEKILETGFFIPDNIKHGRFTQFAFDNLDFRESTMDGKTTHGTTHIIYQYPLNSTETNFSSSTKVSLHKPRGMSLSTVKEFQTTPVILTSADRQESRSLCGIKLVPEEQFHDDNISLVNFLYNLCQGGSTDLLDFLDELKPTTWKQFHEMLIADPVEKTTIGYGPFFPESPTRPDVVAESVNYCVGVAKELGQDHCIITCDQAIYEIVLTLQKKYPKKYGNIIIRMGGFHIVMNFLGAIGYLMKSTGIEDILVNSGICQAGTVNKLLDGKDYYAMIHAHTVVERAMFGLLWESFESWTLEQGDCLEVFSELSNCISGLSKAINEQHHEQVMMSYAECMTITKTMRQKLDQFIKMNLESPTSKLWIMYLDMIGILKRFIAAERSGNWNLHIQATEEMLPYIVSAGHSKYTSCLPHYITAMKSLPSAVKLEFTKGNFTVRQQRGKFNGVWSDMALEKTYNKDAKTKLLLGITKHQDTISKYLKALPILTGVSDKVLEMAHMKHESESSERSVLDRDLKQIDTIKSTVVKTMVNPFLVSSENLMNISSGETTLHLELIDAKKKGVAALVKTEQANAKKVDPVKLKTFVEYTKKKPVVQQTMELYKEERAVIRDLCFVENLGPQEKAEAFSYEWTKFPSSLFQPDSLHPDKFAMRKGNKSDYANMIERTMGKDWKAFEELPEENLRTGYFIDLMALIQRLQNLGCSTFEELSKKYLDVFLQMRPNQCNIVHVVGDRYDFGPKSSLKAEERLRRQKSIKKVKLFRPHDNLQLPAWKGYLDSNDNKQYLEEYLLESWTSSSEWIPPGCEFIFGGMKSGPAKHVSAVGVMDLECLECEDHEEADTRIFAHIAFSSKKQSCKRAVVYATDTDILVLGIYHSARIQDLTELWMQKQSIFIPCHWISHHFSNSYSKSVGSAILCAYALTGCDTVSYMFNRGKKRALKVALDCHRILEPFAEYGLLPECNLDVSEAILDSACRYTCALYGKRNFQGSMDELRCHMFRTTKSDIRSLPPTSDAFCLHVKRALYQILIWKRATLSKISLPTPTGFGRNTDNGYLLATRMTKSPKPNLPSSKCNCKKDKCRSRCPCRKAEVKCTKECRCDADPQQCYLAAENSKDNEHDYFV